MKNITQSIVYVGASDKSLDLFENQYAVPNGVSYNSYLIFDDKTVLMDTVDKDVTEEWLDNINNELSGRKIDYLVVSHMEPDHAANITKIVERYPDVKLVGNAKTFTMMSQFFNADFSDREVVVKEGDTLNIGKHTLQFFMAPMVHWPEVMVTYEQTEKVLFSADGFGKFGALDVNEDWADEARRYYINIVGKYGAQVQGLLKKASGLDISIICPLHGPVLKENLGYYIDLYNTWSSYKPECDGVLIAYASIHGNTEKAAHKMAEILQEKNVENVVLRDLSRADMSQVIAEAYKYDKMIAACATYDGGMFPCMEDFINHLKSKNYQNRKVALIENGTWAAMAGKLMKTAFEAMKNIQVCEKIVTIKSAMNDKNVEDMYELADELLK